MPQSWGPSKIERPSPKPTGFHVRPSSVALALVGVAIAFFALRPGFGSFSIALIAFFLWVGSLAVEFLLRLVRRGTEVVEQAWDGTLGTGTATSQETGAPPGDPALRQLWERFLEFERDPGLHAEARLAIQHLQRLPDLFERYQSLLQHKLSPGELTYERYLASGRQAYEMTVLQLQDVSNRMNAVQPLLSRGTGRGAVAPAARNEPLQRIRELLGQTDEALTQFSRINVAITEMKGNSQADQADFRNAMEDLRNLAERAKRY